MRQISYLFLFIILAGIFVSSVLAQDVPTYKPPTLPAYATDRIIVKYKDTTSTPQSLTFQVQQRNNKKNSGITGLFDYYMQTLSLRSQNKKTPEELLAQVNDTKSKLGITQEKRMFPQTNPGLTAQLNDRFASYNLISTNKSKPIEQVRDEYAKLPEVEFALLDRTMYASADVNDPQFSQQWEDADSKMQMNKAWDITQGSAQVAVAVIDTGADYSHPDLKDHLLPGHNALVNTPGAQDDHGHGTHVSGTISAVTNNSTGVAGLGYNVKIFPIKALDSSGAGSMSTVLSAIKYAVDHADDNDAKVKVMNMSLGDCRYGGASPNCTTSGQDSCSAFNDVIQSAVTKGITIVVASGNDNKDASLYAPASCNGVISVSSTTSSDTKSSFSNYGTSITIAAPGSNILSTCLGSKYCQMSGTSMASPHVAGITALLYSVDPTMTFDKVKALYTNTNNVDHPAGIASAQLGSGRLNGFKAVTAAGGTGSTAPTATPNPNATATATPPPNATTAPTATPNPNITHSPTATPVPGSNPTAAPTTKPTATPIPKPTAIPYTCAPHVLAQVTTGTNCACSAGACTADCKFAPAIPTTYPKPTSIFPTFKLPSTLFPTKKLSPTDTSAKPTGSNTEPTTSAPKTTCAAGSYCLPDKFCLGTKGASCGTSLVCCKFSLSSFPTTGTNYDNTAIQSEQQPTFDTEATNLKCSTKDGADVNDYCTRPYRTIGDADGDGKVTDVDYLYTLRLMKGYPVTLNINADFNGDGVVDDKDLAIVKSSLKSLCY